MPGEGIEPESVEGLSPWDSMPLELPSSFTTTEPRENLPLEPFEPFEPLPEFPAMPFCLSLGLMTLLMATFVPRYSARRTTPNAPWPMTSIGSLKSARAE